MVIALAEKVMWETARIVKQVRIYRSMCGYMGICLDMVGFEISLFCIYTSLSNFSTVYQNLLHINSMSRITNYHQLY